MGKSNSLEGIDKVSEYQTYREQARQAVIQGDFTTAYRLYEELLRAYPDNADILLDYGRAKYREFSDLDQAAVLFKRVLKQQPNSLDARLWLADVSSLGYGPGYAGAANLYRQAIALEPMCVEAHIGLGMLYKNPGSPVTLEEALAAYRQAVVLRPASAIAHNNLGYLLLDAGQMEEAKEELCEAIKLYRVEGVNTGNLQRDIERLQRHETVNRRAYFNDSTRYEWPEQEPV